MKRILLIDPNYGFWDAGTICRHSQFEPLGIEYVGAKVKQAGYRVKIIQQRHLTVDQLVKKVLQFKPDVVGFSTVTCTFNTATQIASKLKKACSNIVIVFGGYHVSALPGVCKEENIDYVVIGEGEETFLELIQNIESGRKTTETKGIAFFDGRLIITHPKERINNLDSLPFPIRKKEILQECKIESLSWPPVSKQKSVAQVLFSRGCPFNCTFCCSPNLWGQKVKFRDPKNVVNEIRELNMKFGTDYVFFADLTFNLNQNAVFKLCHELTKSKLGVNWYTMCRPQNIDPKIISSMESAGCTKIAYGIDGLNNATLKRIKPQQRTTIRLMKQALSITQRSSIISRAFIIIGYPWETKLDLLYANRFVKTLPIDDLRIGILTPLPGSAMYDEFKKKGVLLHEDFSKYTTEECVIKLKDVEPRELLQIREKIFKEFYQSKEYDNRMKEKIRKYPHLKQSYNEFFEFLDSKGVFK